MQNVIFERIERQIHGHPVVLYIKGDCAFPRCSFSAAAVQILSQIGVPFKDINVLEDPELYKAIKEFSDWPFIPQLYIKGAFIGGCDIMREIYKSGELQSHLKQCGLITGR
jgi:monothiol glutaredoxin